MKHTKLSYQKKVNQMADKLMDLANLVAGAMIFTQAFASESFDLEIAGLGIGITLWIYGLAWYIKN